MHLRPVSYTHLDVYKRQKYYLYVDTSNTDISTSDLTTLNGKRIGMLPNALPAEMFHELSLIHI